MSWEEMQDRLTLEARLLSSSPEAVFEELKKLSAKTRADRFWNYSHSKYESSLIDRNERLINLGLAAYGTNSEVLKALYKHGLEPAQDASDASYKEGLRIGCLSNNTAPETHIIFSFPESIIGPEETRRVLNEANFNEASVLIQNPKVSDDLLEALYRRQGAFADTPEERWLHLVDASASNARLVTEYEYEDMPDMGHYGIQKSIFELLGTAPVNLLCLRVLHHLLDQLNFRQVHSPESIDHVLNRWAQLPHPEKSEGYYTNLSIRDEFRCFIAVLYGRGFTNKNTVIFGKPDADDVALRCAYYAKGELTAKDMEAGYKKDEAVFSFAAIFNYRVHERRELRKVMEREYLLYGELNRRWLKCDEQLRKPLRLPPVSEALVETTTPDVQSSITELQKGVATLTTRVSELRTLMIVGAIILGVLIYFRFR